MMSRQRHVSAESPESSVVRKQNLVLLLLLLLGAVGGCEEDNPVEPPFVSVEILSPVDSAVVTDSLLAVRVNVQRNCGCRAWVEYYIDSTHVMSAFVEPYAADLDVQMWTGHRRVIARAVVPGRAEGSDTTTVIIR